MTQDNQVTILELRDLLGVDLHLDAEPAEPPCPPALRVSIADGEDCVSITLDAAAARQLARHAQAWAARVEGETCDDEG